MCKHYLFKVLNYAELVSYNLRNIKFLSTYDLSI